MVSNYLYRHSLYFNQMCSNLVTCHPIERNIDQALFSSIILQQLIKLLENMPLSDIHLM